MYIAPLIKRQSKNTKIRSSALDSEKKSVS